MDQTQIKEMAEKGVTFAPDPAVAENAWVSSLQEYEALYQRSIDDPEGFWAERAEQDLHWTKKWDKVLNWSFDPPKIEWFIGGKLNAAYNCIDRHLDAGRGEKPALVFEADDEWSETYTYNQLHDQVTRFANVLKKYGVKKGDRVALYLPMIPQLPMAMLACARIGAIHMVVFGGFSAEALQTRIDNCGAKLLVTSDVSYRGSKQIPLKVNADTAIAGDTPIEHMIVVKRGDGTAELRAGRDSWWHEELAGAGMDAPVTCEEMDAEDPLFILYTSGSTGAPKGVLHTTGGYMVFAHETFKNIFDYHEADIHFCTADIGWITGHTYIVYGPLSVGATSVLFEGLPTYPKADRFWQVVEKHKVTLFYTAPTAIRMLMGQGDEFVDTHEMPTLRLIGSVGEPINPMPWLWYYYKVGKGRCPLLDTWWQTETGGILITPLAGAHTLKPSSASRPFFGVEPIILRDDGSEADVGEDGHLCIKAPWPGMMRGTWGDIDNKRFKEVYFERFPGLYYTGDGCTKDADGDYWLKGRIDDVLNVSGHRIGTADVESALVSHPKVAEAAVVGYPHDIKGTGIYTYVTLMEGVEPSDELKKELAMHVRKVVGPIATPDKMQFAPALPKTRSGKIMRRILRKIAEGKGDLGDTSTLADPAVVEDLKAGKQ